MTAGDQQSGEGLQYRFDDPPMWYKALVWLCFFGAIAILIDSVRIWMIGVS